MKLSKAQSDAIFDLIRKELNSIESIEKREEDLGNKKREKESIEKFLKTPEYAAIMLLSKTFKGKNIDLVGWGQKRGIEILAHRMFKPERKRTFFNAYEQRPVIELLAIDCKNLAELKQKINVHYNLKNKLK